MSGFKSALRKGKSSLDKQLSKSDLKRVSDPKSSPAAGRSLSSSSDSFPKSPSSASSSDRRWTHAGDLKKTEESPKRRSSLSKGIGVGQQRSSSQLLAGGYAFDDSFQPIAGETILAGVFNDVSTSRVREDGAVKDTGGFFWLTDLRIFMKFYSGVVEIYLNGIYKYEKIEQNEAIVLYCRDVRTESITFANSKQCKDIMKHLAKHLNLKSYKGLPCYRMKKSLDFKIDGWRIFDPRLDFKRQGINQREWSFLKDVNKTFKELAAWYPKNMLAPAGVDPAILYSVSSARLDGCVPCLSYTYSKNNGLLLRAGFLYAHHLSMGGEFGAAQNPQSDLAYTDKVVQMSNQKRLILVTARSAAQIESNFRKGTYRDAEYKTANLPTSEEFVEIGHSIARVCDDSSFTKGGRSWKERVQQTKWLPIVFKLLRACNTIVRDVKEGFAVMVLADRNQGFASQCCALSGIILDPFYRTIKGFCVLIEKCWCQYGDIVCEYTQKHKTAYKRPSDPHCCNFLLFLDCVFQLCIQYPTAFEFTSSLLDYIMEQVFTARFGTFVFFSELERFRESATDCSHSIWSEINEKRGEFVNLDYAATSETIFAGQDIRTVVLWNSYFLRHKSRGDLLKAKKTIASTLKSLAKTSSGDGSLNLSQLNLPYLPPGSLTAGSSYVSAVDASHNFLNALPSELSCLSRLRTLNVGGNQIRNLSDSFIEQLSEHCKDLTELNLSDNGLLRVPESIVYFRKLKSLNLGLNLLESVPNLGSFVDLTDLILCHNRMVSVPAEAFQLENLRSLDVSGNGLKEFPPGLDALHCLESLQVSDNALTSLPPGFQHLTALKVLNIANNKLDAIPNEIWALTNLEDLNLRDMALETLPGEIGKLVKLTSLDLSGNSFDRLPELILELKHMERLDLKDNKLIALPLDIARLSSLTDLNVKHNQLQTMSAGIGTLSKLVRLDISHNKIVELPAAVGFLRGLETSGRFNFEENKDLKFYEDLMAGEDLSALFVFLRAKLDGSERCYRMKLMVVGQENVGKTSLLRCMTKKTHIDKELMKATKLTSMSTDGIDIGQLIARGMFPDENGNYVKKNILLNAWDFAGQEIYYTTHQFFLSDRALYVVVWNLALAEEESRVEYWIKSIAARSEHASMLLVGTHADHPNCTKEYVEATLAGMEQKYNNMIEKEKLKISILGYYPVSCSDMTGISYLFRIIESAVSNMPKMGEEYPKRYLQLEELVKNEALERRPPAVSYAEFQRMGRMVGIDDDRTLLNASLVLHRLGSLIHFQKDKALNDLVVLNPQWLTDVMASIITTKHQFSRSGVLEHKNIMQIWRDPDFPPSMHDVLLSLLQKFEIMYYLKSTRTDSSLYTGKSLIPCLLPEERPTDMDKLWSRFPSASESQCGRRYVFNFIPHGFVSRLLVRLLHFAEPAIFWRYGMVIQKGDQRILIESGRHIFNIDITIRGPGTGAAHFDELAQLIIEGLNALIDGWFNVRVEIFVPCIHCIREHMYDPYLFTLEECEQAAIDRTSVVKCGGVRDIRLDELVPDVAMTHVAECRLDYADIEMGEKVGRGGFATVYRAVYEGNVVAVKVIKFNKASDEAQLSTVSQIDAFKEFRREVWIMSGLVHPNLVIMNGFTLDPITIVTEFIQHGTLYDLIHLKPDFDLHWELRWRLAVDMAKGMRFLHSTSPPVIHRDLKTPNVLVSSLDPYKPNPCAKVADFGLSQILASQTKGRAVANPIWLAPEVMKDEQYDELSDVYSFGVMMYELGTREDFFGEISFMSQLENKVIAGERPPLPDSIPEEFRQVIEACWAGDPADRPDFNTIVEDLLVGIQKRCPDIYEAATEVVEVVVPRKKVERVVVDNTEPEPEDEDTNTHIATEEELAQCCSALSPLHKSSVQCMCFVSDRNQMWTGTSDGTIGVWDASSAKKVKDITAHSKRIYQIREMHGSVWTLSQDQTMKIWDTATGACKKTVKGAGEYLCFIAVGKAVWCGTTDSFIVVLDAKTGAKKKKFKVMDHIAVFALLYLPEEDMVWAGTDRHIVRIQAKSLKGYDYFEAHSKKITDMCIVGSLVWSASADRAIGVWKRESGECVKVLQGHTGPVFALVRKGVHVLSASWDKSVIAWDAEYKSLHKEYHHHNDAVSCLANAQCSGLVWSGSWDNSLATWKIR